MGNKVQILTSQKDTMKPMKEDIQMLGGKDKNHNQTTGKKRRGR